MILVPLMRRFRSRLPSSCLRFSLSKMDVPTAVVRPWRGATPKSGPPRPRDGDSRARPAPRYRVVLVPLIASAATRAFHVYMAGGLKILYDLLIYANSGNASGRPRSSARDRYSGRVSSALASPRPAGGPKDATRRTATTSTTDAHRDQQVEWMERFFWSWGGCPPSSRQDHHGVHQGESTEEATAVEKR